MFRNSNCDIVSIFLVKSSLESKVKSKNVLASRIASLTKPAGRRVQYKVPLKFCIAIQELKPKKALIL